MHGVEGLQKLILRDCEKLFRSKNSSSNQHYFLFSDQD